MVDETEPTISVKSFDDLKPLSFTSSSALDDWQRFKKKFTWMVATLPKNATNDRKVGLFMTKAGDEAIDIYDTLGLADKPTLNEVITAYDNYVQLKKNTVFDRSVFYKLRQKPSQTIDSFVLQLKLQAEKCDFHKEEKDKLIRDFLVLGLTDVRLQEELLRDSTLDLTKAVNQAKIWERSKIESKALSQETQRDELAVDRINRTVSARHQSNRESQVPSSSKKEECSRCGYIHRTSSCPAMGKECGYCHAIGHFKQKCLKRLSSQKSTSEVKQVEDLKAVEDLKVLHLYAVKETVSSRRPKGWFESIVLFNRMFTFKIDTGAEANTLSEHDYRKIHPRPSLLPTRVALKPYMSDKLIIPLGKISVKYSDSVQIDLYIIPGDAEIDNLLSLETSEAIGFIKRSKQVNQLSVIEENQSLFEGLGKIPGTCSIELNPAKKPVIARRRRFAQAVLPRLKKTLETMEKLGVIEPIKKPTEWVSNILVVEKNTKDIRICLDSRELNEAIIIPKYNIPRPDELISQLANKKVYTVVDMSSGFWHLCLDSKSAEYTTFQTPFGRYFFKRLCFGLSSAPELFMQKIIEIFGDIENCFPYFDDLIIAGKDLQEHDETLKKVFRRAHEYNVRFNKRKLQYRQNEVRFLGVIINADGIKVNPDRILAIKNFQKPENKKAVLRFLGMIKYLSPFIPNVSMHTTHLRELTKNTKFTWTDECDSEFQMLKNLLSQTPTLCYFDPMKPIVIQTDSSQSGIGSCLLQNEQPVAYASRALTRTEKQYSQIEKELLAIVYAVEKFHYFVYGHQVTVHSDHKPLENILKKPFDKISARLQRLCLRLLKYNINVVYMPGSQMFIADALSRAYCDEEPNTDYLQDLCVHTTEVLTITKPRYQHILEATDQDPDLLLLKKYLPGSWPKSKTKFSATLKKFWSLKHLISIQEGLLFFENRLIVPHALKNEMLQQLHNGHLNVNKTLALAKNSLYWFGMQSDILAFVNACTVCAKYRRNNTKEPLKLLPLTTRPWERLSTDILTEDNRDYLAVYDSYSYWLEIFSLKEKSAAEVIKKLKSLFNQFGSPVEVVSDNVPFNCELYKNFAEKYNFTPIYSSPKYSQSNGFAEKGVAIAESLIRKNDDLGEALLRYRAAPIPHIGYSPAQIFFNRNIKTDLPVQEAVLNEKVDHEKIQKAKIASRQLMQNYYNRSAGAELSELYPGDPVMIKRSLSDKEWKLGKVKKRADTPRSYEVQEDGGPLLRRNRRFLRPVCAPNRLITEM